MVAFRVRVTPEADADAESAQTQAQEQAQEQARDTANCGFMTQPRACRSYACLNADVISLPKVHSKHPITLDTRKTGKSFNGGSLSFYCIVPPKQVIIMNENGELLSSSSVLG